jgi:antitoxin component YwqK of YwqJK toxin-antitoxin module
MANGKKEGKWIEYLDWKGRTTSDTNAPEYILTMYKKGIPFSIERRYTKLGVLEEKVYYTNGISDSLNLFDENGQEIR